jgi:GTPase
VETDRPAPARPRGSPEGLVRIAILGKPNVGKSSLANKLTGEDNSIVSPIPGTTRDVVEGNFVFKGRTFRILDTAGIRRKSKVTDHIEYYSVNRAIESVSNADLVFLTIDASEGLVDQDKKIAAHAVKEGRGVVIVLGKWDLLKGTPKLLATVTEMVRFQFPVLGFAPVAPVSAVTGYGVKALLETSLGVWDQLHRRVGTGKLNQSLEEWMTHYRLPVRGKNYKIRFITQVGANPVRFIAFVNRMSGFPVSYSQYLENCVRRDLGFSQVPVSIEFRQSKKT